MPRDQREVIAALKAKAYSAAVTIPERDALLAKAEQLEKQYLGGIHTTKNCECKDCLSAATNDWGKPGTRHDLFSDIKIHPQHTPPSWKYAEGKPGGMRFVYFQTKPPYDPWDVMNGGLGREAKKMYDEWFTDIVESPEQNEYGDDYE